MNIESLLIADDHALIRNGLKQIIEQQNLYQIYEADNGKDALDIIRNKKPSVAILDIEMPEMTGFDVAKYVHNEGIDIDVIFLTMYKDESLFNKAMDIGVKGFVLKENTVSEIVKCLNTVINGNYYLSPAISDFLVRRNSNLISEASDKAGLKQLTPTEKTILKLLSDMKTNQEIAVDLNISKKTVQNHRNNMCNKLDLNGAHALLKFAMEHSKRLA